METLLNPHNNINQEIERDDSDNESGGWMDNCEPPTTPTSYHGTTHHTTLKLLI